MHQSEMPYKSECFLSLRSFSLLALNRKACSKDKRDVVLKTARKMTRALGGGGGGSHTPLLRRNKEGNNASVVSTLRLTKATVDEMVFIAECYDGTRRALGGDESPVEVLTQPSNGVRRLLLVSPVMLTQLPDAVVTPEGERPVATQVTLDDSDEEIEGLGSPRGGGGSGGGGPTEKPGFL